MSSETLERRIKAGDPAGFAETVAEMEDPPSVAGATFEKLRLLDFDFSGVDLSNTEWNACNLERIQFGDANLEGAFFERGQLTECTFAGADLSGACFEAVIFARTELRAIIADGLEIENCQLTDCALRELVLDEVSWSGMSATRITLETIDGRSGELTGLMLREATFIDVDFSGLTCDRCRASSKDGGALPAGFHALGKRRSVS